MDLIMTLDQSTLVGVRAELLRMEKEKLGPMAEAQLNFILLDDFCFIMLSHWRSEAENEGDSTSSLSPSELLRRVRMLCQLFDSVDVDSRGFISWSDLTNYCLRAGRIQLKENSYHSSASYTQDTRNLTPLFPIQKLFFVNKIQLLFGFDSETPTAFYFRRNGSHGRFNPLKALSKLLKLQKQTRLSYSQKKEQDKKQKESRLTSGALLFGAARAVGGAPADSKGKILCMEYMERFRQLVFCSSDCYITFVDIHGWEDGRESFHVLGYAIAEEPQTGVVFSTGSELLLTWTGEGSDNHAFQVWDPYTRALRFQVLRHDAMVLCACQITLSLISSATGEPTTGISGLLATSSEAHLMVSSSFDKKLLLWSLTPLIATVGGFETQQQETEKFTLRGNFHAIRSICYAPVHELIIGAGFDFDIFAWSPRTRNLVLKLSGHINTVLSISVLSAPQERLASMDERGIVKIWSLDNKGNKLQDNKGEMQSMQLDIPQPPKVYDITSAFDGGRTIAVVAERVHFCRLDADATSDMRAVPRGLGVCERTGRVWLVSRRVVSLGRLRDGILIKRLSVFDEDRVDSKNFVYLGKRKPPSISAGGSGGGASGLTGADTSGAQTQQAVASDSMTPRYRQSAPAWLNSSTNDEDGGAAATGTMKNKKDHQTNNIAAKGKGKDQGNNNSSSGSRIAGSNAMSYEIDPMDVITSMVTDDVGKKTFIGTMEGHVLLFDSSTFGLLANLTNTQEFNHQRQQQHGSVVRLNYVPRDELVVACYSGGALKVFIGIHRTGKVDAHVHVPAAPSSSAAAATPATATTATTTASPNIGVPLSSSSHLLSGSPGKAVRQFKQAVSLTSTAITATTTTATAAAAAAAGSGSNHHHHHHHGKDNNNDGRPKSPQSSFPFPTGLGGKPPLKPELLRSMVLREKHPLIFHDAVTSQDYNLIAVACRSGLVRVYDYINLDPVCAYAIPKAAGLQVEVAFLAFLPHVPILVATDLCGRITAWTVRPMVPAWVCTWSVIPPEHLDAFSNTATTAAAMGEGKSGKHKESQSDIDSFGQPITCIQPVYYTEPTDSSSVSTRNLTAALNAVEGRDDARIDAIQNRMRHASIARSAARRASLKSGTASTAAGAVTPGVETPGEAAKRRGVWVLLLGDEMGRLHCIDISVVVYKSGGVNEQFSPAAYVRTSQPVYQKINRVDNTTEHALTSSKMLFSEFVVGAGDKKKEQDQQRAVGIDVTKNTPCLNGIIPAHDILWVRRWWAHGDTVQAIVVLQDDRARYRPKDRHERAMPDSHFCVHPVPVRPNFIFTTSDRGVIALWNWEGKKLGFIPDNLDEQYHDEEAEVDHAKSSSSLKIRGHNREEERARSLQRKRWWRNRNHNNSNGGSGNKNTIGDSGMTADEYLKNFFSTEADDEDENEKGGWSLHMPHWGSKRDSRAGVTQVLSAVATALEDTHEEPPKVAIGDAAYTTTSQPVKGSKEGKGVAFAASTSSRTVTPGGATTDHTAAAATAAAAVHRPSTTGGSIANRPISSESLPMSPGPGFLQRRLSIGGMSVVTKLRPLDFIDSMVAWVIPRLQYKEKLQQWEEEKSDFNYRLKSGAERPKHSLSGPSSRRLSYAATVQALLTGSTTPKVIKSRPLTPTQALKLDLNEDSREFGASVSHASLIFDSQSSALIFDLDMNEDEREKERIKKQMNEWAHALDENARVDEYLTNRTDDPANGVLHKHEVNAKNSFRLNGKLIGVGGDPDATFAYYLEKQKLRNFEQEIAKGANTLLRVEEVGGHKLGDGDDDMKKLSLDRRTAEMLKHVITSYNQEKEEKKEIAMTNRGNHSYSSGNKVLLGGVYDDADNTTHHHHHQSSTARSVASVTAMDAIRQAKTNEFTQPQQAASSITNHSLGIGIGGGIGGSSHTTGTAGHNSVASHLFIGAGGATGGPRSAFGTASLSPSPNGLVSLSPGHSTAVLLPSAAAVVSADSNTGAAATTANKDLVIVPDGSNIPLLSSTTGTPSSSRQTSSRSRPQSAFSTSRRPLSVSVSALSSARSGNAAGDLLRAAPATTVAAAAAAAAAAASFRPGSASQMNAAATRAGLKSGWKAKTVKQADARHSKMDDILKSFDRMGSGTGGDNDDDGAGPGRHHHTTRHKYGLNDDDTDIVGIAETMINAVGARTTGGGGLVNTGGLLAPIEEGFSMDYDFSVVHQQAQQQTMVTQIPPDLPDRLNLTAKKYAERLAAGAESDKKHRLYSDVTNGRAIREARSKKIMELKVRQASAVDGVFDVVKARQEAEKSMIPKLGGMVHLPARGRYGMSRVKEILSFMRTLADLYEPHVLALREMIRKRNQEREQKQRAAVEAAAVQAIRLQGGASSSSDLLGSEDTSRDDKFFIVPAVDEAVEDPVIEELKERIVPDDHRFSVNTVLSHPDIYKNSTLMELIMRNDSVSGSYDKTIGIYGLIQAAFYKSFKGEWDRIFAFVKAAMFIREVLKILMPPLPIVKEPTSCGSPSKAFFGGGSTPTGNTTQKTSRSINLNPSGMADQIRESFAGSSTLMMMAIKRTDSSGNILDYRAPPPKRPNMVAAPPRKLGSPTATAGNNDDSPTTPTATKNKRMNMNTQHRSLSTEREGGRAGGGGGGGGSGSISVGVGGGTISAEAASLFQETDTNATAATATNATAADGNDISDNDILLSGNDTTPGPGADATAARVRPSLRVSTSHHGGSIYSAGASPISPLRSTLNYHGTGTGPYTGSIYRSGGGDHDVVPPLDSYMGWRLDHKGTERLEELFDELYDQESGTVSVQDVIDMIHEYAPAERHGDSLEHLAHTMQVHGANLDAEVTGAVACKIFEVGLEIHLIRESELKNKSPSKARKLRLTVAQPFASPKI